MDIIIAIEDFFRHMRSIGYADSTIESYEKGLRDFCHFLKTIQITSVTQVTGNIIDGYRVSVMEAPLAPESKALRLRPVKRLFEYLVQKNHLLINPVGKCVEVTRQNRSIGPVLSIAEMKHLLSVPDMQTLVGIRNRAIMETFYSTGIRLGELLGLQVDDLDLLGCLIFVRRGKGARQRMVPIGKNADEIVSIYLEKVRPVHDTDEAVTKVLFLTVHGMPITDRAIRMFLWEYKKIAGIDGSVSPHVFRRSCATHFLQKGAGIRYVQQLLGHSSLRVTHYYTKILPVDLKKCHEDTHPGVDYAAH